MRTETYTYDPITGGVASHSIYGPGKVPGTDQPDQVINHAYQQATGRHTRTWTTSNDTSYAYDELGNCLASKTAFSTSKTRFLAPRGSVSGCAGNVEPRFSPENAGFGLSDTLNNY